ncbi:2-oxoglutarate dehydrogenase complex dihydrolipoyllysine-residue succinyltransferase [Oxalobacter paraformigenes]|uniref:Dihydrolipoyllysine-residue succinyltransferase component of 2-oxoglutarate dehydrogenase complex n=1 Tax=Oxalobacter paraformigenes TaxID=556268 RepID=C3X446_9BURK|nr:2-oxoglutarate dehydrogenase complex dihydrolipoyllysine-residue succinyltransferase [Oxalobacter paraformigenes]EEO27982.1 hypothetical protein OFAG_01135 [Oxalobacter paraformigenes]
MAVLEVKVPQLSESVTEATLLQWHKKAGEKVALDENLVDIETDKVVLELPSPAAGVLASIVKKDGDIVVAGEVIATIDTAGAAETGKEAAATAAPAKTAPAAVSGPVGLREAETAASTGFDSERDMPDPADYPSGIVMPAAARMIAELGMDETEVVGTGKDGRVTKQDVERAWAAKGTDFAEDEKAIEAATRRPARPSGTPSVPSGSTGQETVYGATNRTENRVPMSRLRARVAERLIQSQQSTASLTTFNEVNMQPVLDLRRKFGELFEKEHGVRLGLMSFFVKAAIAALKRFPIVNASIDGNDIVYHGYYDIGIAISSPRGLVVPIMRDADLMTIAEIEKKINELSIKAKEGQLTLEDLTGGTFSISNGGIFGSMLSTPIINPPQSAILGIHATKERPVVEDGQIVIRPMNYLALSYDHRLIDGREAVLALRTMKETLEDPARLLLDL